MVFDMRTVLLLGIIAFIVCTLFIMQLWKQNRRRFAGMLYWVFNFAMQTAALVLIALRDVIPVWISIVCSNTLVIAGILVIYMGMERFVNKKGRQFHNYILLIVFVCVHTYFTFVLPSLAARNLNLSAGMLLFCFQCSWLMLHRVGPDLRPLTLWVGIVYCGYCVVSIIRIVEYFVDMDANNNFFQSGTFQPLMLTAYEILFIILTYGLAMMVNKRLLIEIGSQEEKFSKAFHSAPYAVYLTRLSDGMIFDVNETFVSITGYDRDDAIGKKTMDLHIWESQEDRNAVVDILSKNGKVQGMDLRFRKKNGEPATGLFTAEIILINGEECILSSIGDITDRKRAEENIRNLLAEKELILKEVHHRIKNNMSTIMSMLSLQSNKIKNPAAIAALKDAEGRVRSMMVLYDKLYRSDNFQEVSIKEYLSSLINDIVSNFPNSASVKIEKNMDDFKISAKILFSFGIIINELLTNIMKYAFTGRADGLIIVSASMKDNRATVSIQDNGNGMPESIDIENSTGFGLRLVGMLTKQIDGTIRIERMNGTRIILEFEK